MPRGRPRTFEKDDAIDAVVTLLWREGVRGISLNDLATRISVPKPALSRAFGSKDTLIAAALRRYYQEVGAGVEDVIANAPSASAVVSAYLDYFVRAHTGEHTPPGCLLASASCDCASLESGPIRDAIDELNAQGRDILLRRLSALETPDADRLTAFVTGQTVAMSVMARNGASRSDLQAFADMAKQAVGPANPPR